MTKWLLVCEQCETAGDDYLERIAFLGAVIEADTLRKAQNKAKKVYPNIRFGGMFGPFLYEATAERVKLYAQPGDIRLRSDAKWAHRAACDVLRGEG